MALRPAPAVQAGDQADDGRGNEPGDLTEELVVEEAERTDFTAEARAAGANSTATR